MTARHVHSSGAQVRRFDHWRPAAIRILGGAAVVLALAAVVAAGIESAPRVDAAATVAPERADGRRPLPTPTTPPPAPAEATAPTMSQAPTPETTSEAADGALVAITSPSPVATSPAPDAVTPEPVAPAATPTGLVELVNADRAAAGCGPVTYNAVLAGQASTWSEQQAREDRMYHSPGVTGYGTWGENVAVGYGSEVEVHAAWIASPPHRANVLNCSYSLIGFASADGPSGLYWTEMFAGE